MHIQHYSKPSPQKREGEDALLLNPVRNIYGVLDGVTPIADYRDSNGHNGAYLASNTLKAYLERIDGNAGSLVEEIAAANAELRQAMLRNGIDTGIKHELWASCIAAVHVTPDGIRFAQLGDCMAVARYMDGRVVVLTQNRVKGVSARAKAKRERDRKNGVSVPEESTFAELFPVMVYNRTFMANTPEGYGVANGTEEAVGHIQSGLVPTEGLTHVLLVSDGMFHPDLPLETTMELILQEGFERYVERVEQAERDKSMAPDDRSAVLLSWK
ncbi:protein phosphatase 2C domain-containing protein [Paenibacillus mesophilus]|uniref:protein phosphatase 2C domain-containing protein n=1 Tax=Paenibacillus mesophilus TaxID=2582849 RepID=UPI00110DFC8F|nr:protein phosphatase 2C domain-containing protein [Paenibacillus mesophilus]TMV52134.1 protein phosphatase 2C domain-containing protein [Paenibacillus mesophilus]